MGELHDGVEPVAETVNTLSPVEDQAVAEDELVLLRIRPDKFQKQEERQRTFNG